MGIVTKVKALSARATMSEQDVRALLVKDHDEAKAIAKEMQETSSAARRTALLQKLKPALTAHSRAEEAVVYDALLRVRADEDSHELADEGYVEHSLVDELLERLTSTSPGTDRWKAHAKVLHEVLGHHIDEEQTDIFAKLGDTFESAQLEAMGADFLREKAAILRGAKSPPTAAKKLARKGSAKRASASSRKPATSKRSRASGAGRASQKRTSASAARGAR
ncbi:MAG: hemerythrin domain-containing protein [Rudaea sp.]